MRKSTSKTSRVLHYIHNVKLAKKPNKNGHLRAKKRKPRNLPPYLTLPEKDRFFKAIDSTRDRAIFRLLYHHGLRAGEIAKLQFSDFRPGITADADRIYIRRLKGSVTGEHAMVPAAAFAMRAWIRKRGIKPGTMFPSRQGGPITRQMIFVLMRKYCEKAQIPHEKAHPHSLKHTCCTHMISHQKESIMDVRSHVGHVSIRSTMVYSDLMSEATEARAKRLRDWR